MGILIFIILVIASIILFKHFQTKEVENKINNIIEKSPDLLIGNRRDALQYMWNILEPVHIILKREALVVIYLTRSNKVINTDVRLGNQTSVSYPTNEIINNAIGKGAKKIVLGHNHPGNYTTPSDQDVYHCSCLFLNASSEGIELMDDLVVCGTSLKSIINTHRFKQMIRSY